MADYQSLLTRAVANLPSTSSAATRQAIYDRARKALVTQLRSLRPPLPDSDIEREERALDKAIAMVESKFASTGAPEAAPAQPGPAPAASAAPSRSAVAAPDAPKPRQPAPPAAASPPGGAPRELPAAPKPARPVPPPAAPAQTRAAPTRPPAPTPPPRPPAAPPSPRPAAPPPVSGAPPAPRAVGGAAHAPIVQVAPHPEGDANAGAAPVVTVAKADGGSAAPANLAKVVPSDQADQAETSGAPPVVVSRTPDAAPLASAPEVPADADRVVSTHRLETEAQRPFAPIAAAEKRHSWPWLAVAVVLGVVLSVAVAAILMRQKPQDLAISPPPEPQQEAAQTPAKIAQRAEPSPAETNAAAPSAPAASEPQGGQGAQGAQPAGAPPEAPNAQLPVAARAAMLVASADNPQKPVVNLGSTVWSTVPAAAGQPAAVAVKAEADIPDLKMHATMILRKNTDPTLQATHTIDLKFSFADGAPITGFKDVGLPQMRKLDSTASEALNSVKVKISDDYFLIALANSEQDLARNLDLMRTRAWFDFPLLLNDDRIAKLVFQKSADGEAMLEQAFDAWK
jgi:hypothetical protein